jgi:uroporphyrinogen-III synthase
LLPVISGCIADRRFDSEALLALPQLVTVNGKKVLILRGDVGRELLADTLRERGAEVDCITCYRRSGPPDGVLPLLRAWHAGQLDALTISSSEGLRYLIDMLDPESRAFLLQTPVFVPHARIADNAKQLGLNKIVLTEGADSGILAGLRAYNWPE